MNLLKMRQFGIIQIITVDRIRLLHVCTSVLLNMSNFSKFNSKSPKFQKWCESPDNHWYNEMWLNESIFIKNKFTFLAFYFPYLFN